MFLLRLISRLPFAVLYAISDVLFLLTFYVVRYRRKMVKKNLLSAFPEKSAEERQTIERKFYRNLCDYAVETLKLLTISKSEIEKRVTFTNRDAVLKFLHDGQSILILTSHQFNWEWLLGHGSFVYGFPMDFVYQRVRNKFFNRVSLESRTRFGAHPILREDVARESIRRKNIVRGLAIVADQYPGYRTDKKYETRFLNQDTVFFYGANQLAVLLQYPVVFQKIRKLRRGYYECSPEVIATPPYDKMSNVVVDNYIKAVEKMIVNDPAGWLWSHNRWKKRHLQNKSPILREASGEKQ